MLDWLVDTYNDFIDFLYACLLSVLVILKDFLIWALDMLLELALLLVDGMAYLMDGLNIAQYIAALPPETSYILSAIGLSEAMGMIVTSLTIRVVLQLIPFTRLGS